MLVAVDGVELTYDEIGNVLTFGNRTFTWNSGRNLAQITDGNNTYSYKYDENGIRTSKTVNGVTTYYNTKDGVILSQSDGTNTMYFQYDTSGTPFGFIYNGTQYFYMTNQMGDVIVVTDSNGDFICEYVYDEWGNILDIACADEENVQQVNVINSNPLRYRGYYYDAETGYYYLQSRYYDPGICRFINADIPEIAQMSKDISTGTNLFAYCNNDAVNNSDPLGLWVVSLVGISMNFIAITGGTFSLQWVFDGYGNNGILVIGSIGFGFSVGISWSTFFSWRRTIFDLRGISQNLYLGLVPFRAFGVGIGITFSFDKRGFCGLGVSAGFSVSRFEGFYAFSVAEIINLPSYKYRTPTRAQALRILRSNAWRLSKRIYKIYRR